MTQLNLGLSSISVAAKSQEAQRLSFSWKRGAIGLVLSFFAPGLGQIYAGRPRRGLVMAVSLTAFILMMGESHLLVSFAGFATFSLVSILVRLYIPADAGYLAAHKTRPNSTAPRPSRTLAAVASVIVLLLCVFPTPDYLLRRWKYFRAFKVTSGSMCPTICVGDRIVADMDAFIKGRPQRGDVIMLKRPGNTDLFIKRVIGDEGDVVSEVDEKILVNGKPFSQGGYSTGCEITRPKAQRNEAIHFQSTMVPPSSFFVIGDNLNNSLDSRVPDFGPVALDQVRGRPLFIYWSPNFSRMGCPILQLHSR